MASLPAFSLHDLKGNKRFFPNNKPSLLCFVREECETCHLSMPLIEAVHGAFEIELRLGFLWGGRHVLAIKHQPALIKSATSRRSGGLITTGLAAGQSQNEP